MSKLGLSLVLAFMATQIVMTVYIISIQLGGVQYRQIINKQNDSIVCILAVEPQDRTKAVIDNCRANSGL